METTEPPATRPSLFWPILTWLAVLVGGVIRFAGIGRQSIWYDEGYTAWMINHSPAEIIHLLRADTAPPLYYLLLHGWAFCFGHSEAGLRAMSAVLSTLTLVLAVRLTRRFIPRPAGTAAAVWTLALSFTQLQYAQEARFYALMAFLVVALLELMCRYLEMSGDNQSTSNLSGSESEFSRSPGLDIVAPINSVPRPRFAFGQLMLIAILVAACLYTHNMMLPYLFALGLAWLILPSRLSPGRKIVDGLIIFITAGVLFSPWAVASLARQFQMVHQNFWVEKPTAFDIAQTIASLAGVRHLWLWDWQLGRYHIPLRTDGGAAAVGLVALILSAIISIGFQPGVSRRRSIAQGLVTLLPPLAVAFYSLVGRPVFLEKVFLPSAALFPIFIFLPMGRRMGVIAWVAGALFMFSVAFTLLAFEINQEKENWRLAAHLVRQLPDHRRLIVLDGNDGQLPFDFYYHLRPDERETGVPVGFLDRDPPRAMIQVNGPADMQPLVSLIEREHYDQVVLIMAHLGWSDQDYLSWKTLATLFPFEEQLDEYKVRDIMIIRFDKTMPTTAPN